jgi:hypothetical protein
MTTSGAPVVGGFQPTTFQAIFPGGSQKASFTGSSSQVSFTAQENPSPSVIRLFATKDCWIKIGTDPTALSDGTCVFIASGIVEYFGIPGNNKLAVISNGADGDLYITEGV